MRTVKTYLPVECPDCRRVRGVNNDGKIRWHGVVGAWHACHPQCPGSDRDVRDIALVNGGLW